MIPAEAVDAAHEQLEGMGAYVSKKYVRAALEEAAPYIAAAAWDRAAASIVDEHGNPVAPTNVDNPYRK